MKKTTVITSLVSVIFLISSCAGKPDIQIDAGSGTTDATSGTTFPNDIPSGTTLVESEELAKEDDTNPTESECAIFSLLQEEMGNFQFGSGSLAPDSAPSDSELSNYFSVFSDPSTADLERMPQALREMIEKYRSQLPEGFQSGEESSTDEVQPTTDSSVISEDSGSASFHFNLSVEAGSSTESSVDGTNGEIDQEGGSDWQVFAKAFGFFVGGDGSNAIFGNGFSSCPDSPSSVNGTGLGIFGKFDSDSPECQAIFDGVLKQIFAKIAPFFASFSIEVNDSESQDVSTLPTEIQADLTLIAERLSGIFGALDATFPELHQDDESSDVDVQTSAQELLDWIASLDSQEQEQRVEALQQHLSGLASDEELKQAMTHINDYMVQVCTAESE